MRLFSEEKRVGTLELLYTSPIKSIHIIMGKYLAGLAFYAVMLVPTMLFQSLLFAYGNPEFLPVISGLACYLWEVHLFPWVYLYQR